MSRFGGKSRESRSSDREERGGSRREAYRGGRGNGRSGGGRGGYSKSRGNDSGFVNLGGVSCTRGTDESLVDEMRNGDLKVGLWWQVFLPEGVNSITLERGQKVLIQLGQFSDKAPDFVVGSVSLPPKEEKSDRGSRRSSRRDDRYEQD